jgi:hypothetical protein
MSDIFSWDKAIDRKVKSSDGKDLGKVQSITHDYIQTKEGIVSKTYYFIPKFYLSGYDGNDLWVSLTKDEAKSKFEREKEPEASEWETPEYAARRTEVTKQHPDFGATIPTFQPATAAQVQMPWDKLIDKKVKSSDREDLGKIESVATDYVEVKEGVVSKKHYFLPKYYIQGFDGDSLYASITKDEIKSRYERDSPPTPEEFKSEEYQRRVRTVDADNPQFVHGVPYMAKEPSTEIPVDYSGTTYDIPWDQLIHKHVRTSDNVEVGYVERIGNEFVVVREGVGDVHIFYVPKAYIREYDGSQLWIEAPSTLVRAKFERQDEPAPEELRALAREAPRFKRPAARRAGEPGEVTVESDVDVSKAGRTAETG